MYVLDTNILIYFLKGDPKVTEFLNDLVQDTFSISIISRLEVLIGGEKEKLSAAELEKYLDLFENINLDKKIVKEAVFLAGGFKKKLKFKDLIVAATAKVTNKTLLTADKDFVGGEGVKVKFF